MATVTGLTAARMLAIEAASVVDGDIVGDDLFLTKKDGSVINAGNVRGAPGPDGPMGHPLSVISAQPVLDVGIPNQIRAGRQLSPTDFTNMGLNTPLALWNLSNLLDSSGAARNLSNKGAVPFVSGINGLAATAAQFAGSAGQALYLPDAGSADPMRVRTGSFACWIRTGRRGVVQEPFSKLDAVGAQMAWGFQITAGNLVLAQISTNGTPTAPSYATVTSTTDVADNRWHFIVMTVDGSRLRLYVDGVLEGAPAAVNGTLFGSTAPINVGGRFADATTGASNPFFGAVDEAFILSEILSDEQVRNLYCASIPHALGSVPTMMAVSVRRRRRGGPFAVTDFPAQPVRLYNFTGGVLTDQGSNNVALAPVGGGSIVDVAGAGGLAGGAKAFSGAHTGLGATDAGLPSGLAARSYGCWIKTGSATNQGVIGWGATFNSTDTRISVLAAGTVQMANGTDAVAAGNVNDGSWHFVCVVEDNSAIDVGRRKLYVDGRLISMSTVMNSVSLGGANRFRVGAVIDGTLPFVGQIDAPFVFGGALTAEQVRSLYAVGSQQMAASPKNEGDFVKAMETARLLATFDAIETVDVVNLAVM